MKKTTLEIIISDIEVTKYEYNFTYQMIKDGKKYRKNTYSSYHERQDDINAFRRELEKDGALGIALIEIGKSLNV